MGDADNKIKDAVGIEVVQGSKDNVNDDGDDYYDGGDDDDDDDDSDEKKDTMDVTIAADNDTDTNNVSSDSTNLYKVSLSQKKLS